VDVDEDVDEDVDANDTPRESRMCLVEMEGMHGSPAKVDWSEWE